MRPSTVWTSLKSRVRDFHNGEEGVAATEYIIIFSVLSFGATLSLLATAVFVKGYRDFMVWWLAHPAV